MPSMQQIKHRSTQLGQTLVEVILVTAIVASVLTAIASGVSLSSRNTNESKKKSKAVDLAQAALEVFHRERYNLGWDTFKNALSDGTYCFNNLPTDSTSFLASSAGACGANDKITGTIFQREVVLTSTVDQLQVEAIVSWPDGNDEKQVSVEQVFKNIN